MKRILIALAVCVCMYLAALADPPVGMDIGNTSVKVAAARTIQNAVQWATNTAYGQGRIVKNKDTFYMAIAGGTSGSNEPTSVVGDVSDGMMTWRHIPKSRRTGFVICNASEGSMIFASTGADAVTNCGAFLAYKGAWAESGQGCPQDAIYAVAIGDDQSATSRVTFLEW